MFPGIAYGNRSVLLSHAGLSWMRRLPVAVQHGWYLYAIAAECSSDPPEMWVWSERIAKDFEKYFPAERIRIVGSYFCYLYNSVKHKLPSCIPLGSIVIPSHSTGDISYEYAVAEYARRLNELGDEYKPIRVMIHPLDLDEEYVNEYRNYDFEVVCNGNGKDFIENFIKNVHGKKYCIYPEAGSGLLYAIYMGLRPLHLTVESIHTNRGNLWMKDKPSAEEDRVWKLMCLEPTPSLVEKELGVEYLLSSREMRRVLIKNYFTRRFLTHFATRAMQKLWRMSTGRN